jgi:hypothetical protein
MDHAWEDRPWEDEFVVPSKPYSEAERHEELRVMRMEREWERFCSFRAEAELQTMGARFAEAKRDAVVVMDPLTQAFWNRQRVRCIEAASHLATTASEAYRAYVRHGGR